MKLIELSELETWMIVYFAVIALILGMVFGSFLNCAAWRISRKKSFIKGRSICPVCKHELSAKDLIPVVSYIVSKGKCRYCGTKISIRYPLTEVFFGVISVVMFLQDGLSVLFIRDFIFACCLFCLSLVDLEIFEIPDGCLIISVLAWILSLPFLNVNLTYILGHIAAGFGFGFGFLILSIVMDRILKKESLGGGDIKLFFVMGLYLGLIGGMFTVMLAAVVGLIFAKGKEKISFGPFISVATWVVLMFGEPLVQWYLDALLL
ncbi:MAG: prepilin peptidase [Lachnospiraceae bacterium]|nr:prepilin peptidase [Lachnospiraceae bacterium]